MIEDWQPIASAPKDGSWFWVLRLPEVVRGINVTAFRWDTLHKQWFAGTGWWYGFPMGFTHWHPMPNVPEALVVNVPLPRPVPVYREPVAKPTARDAAWTRWCQWWNGSDINP